MLSLLNFSCIYFVYTVVQNLSCTTDDTWLPKIFINVYKVTTKLSLKLLLFIYSCEYRKL